MFQKRLRFTVVFLCMFFFTWMCSSFALDRAGESGNWFIDNSWEQIFPEPAEFMGRWIEPSCSGMPGTDPTFSFFVKPGVLPFVVVYFDGGGICWNSFNCLSSPTFQPFIDETVASMNAASGIFDRTNWQNPFRAWTQIYIPYCTGDLHFGSGDHEYDAIPGVFDGQPVTLHHRGFDNFMAVLKWMSENIKRPRRIFISGSSGGSYGIFVGMPYIYRQYPNARITFLSDAGAGVVAEDFTTTQIAPWNVDPDLLSFVAGLDRPFYEYDSAELLSIFADIYPEIKFGQYTSAWDATQVFFYNMTLIPYDPRDWEKWPALWCDWREQMLANFSETAQKPNYRYYIGPGTDHMILQFDKFYTEKVQRVRFVNWVRALVWRPHRLYSFRGLLWRNLECTDCEDPAGVICP